MTSRRSLRGVDAADLPALTAALATVLGGAAGDGPALLPLAPGEAAGPATVPDGVDVVIATSGSSGVPKLVAHSGAALLAGAHATALALGGHGQWLLALPGHYVAGLQVLVRSIAAETTPVLLAPGHFDPDAFVAASARLSHERRFVSLVPAQLLRILDSAPATAALTTFSGVLVGGQSVPKAVRERAETAGIALVRTYGSSETGGGAVYNGSALPGVSVRSSARGELEISGPALALGYLDPAGEWDRDLTAATFGTGAPRWYRTGDAGTVSDAGVAVTGRLDNVLISGGTNVSLDRVEAHVRELPGLGDAVIVASPDERWGQVPVLVTTAAIALAPVRESVRAALGPAAQPDRVLVVDALPRLASGKPDRRALTVRAQINAH